MKREILDLLLLLNKTPGIYLWDMAGITFEVRGSELLTPETYQEINQKVIWQHQESPSFEFFQFPFSSLEPQYIKSL